MKIEKESKENNKILYNSFNQDYTCFIVGTKEGCKIYHSEPFKKGFTLGKKYIFNIKLFSQFFKI